MPAPPQCRRTAAIRTLRYPRGAHARRSACGRPPQGGEAALRVSAAPKRAACAAPNLTTAAFWKVEKGRAWRKPRRGSALAVHSNSNIAYSILQSCPKQQILNLAKQPPTAAFNLPAPPQCRRTAAGRRSRPRAFRLRRNARGRRTQPHDCGVLESGKGQSMEKAAARERFGVFSQHCRL